MASDPVHRCHPAAAAGKHRRCAGGRGYRYAAADLHLARNIVVRDRCDALPETLFAHPDRFDCTTRATDFGAGDFWVLSQPLPQAAVGGPVTQVRQASLWQNRVTLYVL